MTKGVTTVQGQHNLNKKYITESKKKENVAVFILLLLVRKKVLRCFVKSVVAASGSFLFAYQRKGLFVLFFSLSVAAS